MSVTPSQFPVINQVDLDGTETLWAQKGGIDYSLSLSNVKNYGGCDMYCVSLVIPTAQVLTLNATPLTIVPAPGAGYAIEVISASYKLTYNSVAYATNTGLQLINNGATISQRTINSALAATVTRQVVFDIGQVGVASDTQIIENTALQVKVPTGNPTAGNSDIKVYVQYRIITL